MPSISSIPAALLAASACIGGTAAFAPARRVPATTGATEHKTCHHGQGGFVGTSSTSIGGTPLDTIPDDDGGEWMPLVDDAGGEADFPPVCKYLLKEGDGDIPQKGANVELEYTGTLLGEADWSTTDVVDGWLSQLQGLDHLAPAFIENEIDGAKLLDDSFFTEEYCMNELGISNKIQAKKLIMASKRLAKRQEEYPPGLEFDSSKSREKNYSFALGKGKAIQAIDLAVASMQVGERAMVICRCDYGYGAEGLRTSKGDVLVPPFATLCFELKLVSAT